MTKREIFTSKEIKEVAHEHAEIHYGRVHLSSEISEKSFIAGVSWLQKKLTERILDDVLGYIVTHDQHKLDEWIINCKELANFIQELRKVKCKHDYGTFSEYCYDAVCLKCGYKPNQRD